MCQTPISQEKALGTSASTTEQKSANSDARLSKVTILLLKSPSSPTPGLSTFGEDKKERHSMKTIRILISNALLVFAATSFGIANTRADTYSWTNLQSDIAGVAPAPHQRCDPRCGGRGRARDLRAARRGGLRRRLGRWRSGVWAAAAAGYSGVGSAPRHSGVGSAARNIRGRERAFRRPAAARGHE